MVFATVCEVVEVFESKCALVPPIITNLGKGLVTSKLLY